MAPKECAVPVDMVMAGAVDSGMKREPIREPEQAPKGWIPFPARPAELELESADVEVVCTTGPASVPLRIWNRGGAPMDVTAQASEAWLSIQGPGSVEGGMSRRWAVRVDPTRISADQIHRFHKNDFCVTGTIDLTALGTDGEPERRTMKVRAWILRPFDPSSLLFGMLAGIVPFINFLIFAVLAWDAWPKAEPDETHRYRTLSERRDNLSFLIGMAPTMAIHVWLLFSKL